MEKEMEAVLSTNLLFDLFSLPEEIIFNGIFPNLGYEDLLRVRRTCKYLKSLSDSFIQINFTSHVREINETNYTFQLYLQTNLPTTSIYINNSSPSIFNDPHIPSFLNLYGNKITSLKINHFATFISEHELNFFSNLPNLLHLDIKFIDATLRDCSSTHAISQNSEDDAHRDPCPFPQNFKNLKTLKLNQIKGSHDKDHGYPWDFILFCENLEYVRHPIFDNIVCGAAELPARLGPHGPFTCVMDYIRNRRQGNVPNLKFYDLKHFQRTWAFSDNFCDLVNLCYENHVKLVNVPGQLLRDVLIYFGTTPEKYGKSLVSLINIHGYAFYTELPILEKLVIKSIDNSSWMNMLRDGDRGVDGVAKWPSLKTLDLTLDSMNLTTYYPENGDYNCSLELVEFLFRGNAEKREGLTDLAIRYPNNENEEEFDERLPDVNVKSVTDTCPFVKRLTLTCWEGCGGNGDYSICGFWSGLEFLEEVELGNCENIGDMAFVGGSWEDPVFLKLKNLKKLTLKGLERMGLTDKVFERVFRNLTIKEFRLTSGKPVELITAAGIESLLTGDFNNYVEKFPFDGWSLNGVSEEEFSKLKLKFRAADMI